MAPSSASSEPMVKHDPPSDRFQRAPEPRKLDAILLASLKAGGRSAAIAFAARAFLTLLLRLARGKFSLKTLREVVLGDEPLRFAKMFGTFTFVFKALNALGQSLLIGKRLRRASILDLAGKPDASDAETAEPLSPTSDGRPRLSLRSPQFLVASFSGFVAGLAALRFEHKDERLGWAQQFFVRGLQCVVVFLAKERNISVPHGDSMVFMLSCAQIMYAYIIRPSTIPSSYYSWMVKTARVPHDVLEINRRNIRALDTRDRLAFGLPPESGTAKLRHEAFNSGVPDHVLSLENMVAVAGKYGISAPRLEDLKGMVAQRGLPLPICPCEMLHAGGNNGCVRYNAWLFNQVFWEISRVYGVLNIVPVLIFGRRRLMKEPLQVAKRITLSTARSSAFLAVYVTTYMVLTCLMRHLHQAHVLTRDHKILYYLFGIASGCSIFVERDGRRGELAAYVLPKAAESAWAVWADRGYLPRTVKGGDYAMFAAGMGLLMGFYQTAPGYISTLLYALMRRVIS